MREYTSAEIAKMLPVTLRQLQWWDETKVLRPLRNGRCRIYSHLDLQIIRVIATMRHLGIRLELVRASVPKIRRLLSGESASRFLVGIEGSREVTFYPVRSSAEVVRILLLAQRTGKRYFLVPLGRVADGGANSQ